MLSGCTHYAPRPLVPEQLAADFSSRTLEDPGLRQALNKALPARASNWPREQWDRADLLFAMLYFNDALAQGRATVDAASAARQSARQLPNPTFNLAGEYANQHDGSPLWLWGLATDWLLDVGTRRGARISVADLGAQQSGYEFAELAWKTRGELRRALADMLLSEREVTLLEGMQADRDSQLQMVRRQLEVGAASRGAVDGVVGDALLDQQRLYDSRRRASAARSTLAATIGIPVRALEGLHLAWDDLENPPDIPEARLQQWRDESLLQRPDVRSAVLAYSAAEEALRLEVSRQYPDVTVGPGYTWDHGVKRVQLNVLLTLPLLNRNQGPIAEAEARRAAAGASLEATVATGYAQIDEAIRQWRIARARLAQARGDIYDTAQRIYAEMERGFAAGANDRTELVAAKIARTLTELQALDSVRGAQDSLAALEEALRRPLEGPELSFTPATLTEGRR